MSCYFFLNILRFVLILCCIRVAPFAMFCYLQALPDDLKTKLSIDDEIAESPKEALSRASADYRVKYLTDPSSPRFKLSSQVFITCPF